jgi:hypothetical protein
VGEFTLALVPNNVYQVNMDIVPDVKLQIIPDPLAMCLFCWLSTEPLSSAKPDRVCIIYGYHKPRVEEKNRIHLSWTWRYFRDIINWNITSWSDTEMGRWDAHGNAELEMEEAGTHSFGTGSDWHLALAVLLYCWNTRLSRDCIGHMSRHIQLWGGDRQ